MSGSDENRPPSPSPLPYEQSVSETTANSSGSKTGLLSNVFSFVSREITEFVVNAAGVADTSVARPVAGPSRYRTELEYNTEKRQRRQSTPLHSHDDRALKRVRRDIEDQSYVAKLRRDHDLEDRCLPTHLSHNPPALHRRGTSMNMPGSLFSRSPTPDDHADIRHVRFAAGIISPEPKPRRPVRRRISEIEGEEPQDEGHVQKEEEESEEESLEEQGSEPHSEEEETHPSSENSSPSRAHDDQDLALRISPRSSSAIAGPSSNPFPPTPFRPPAIRSVMDVVSRIDGDTPPRPITPSWSAKGKGKMREVEIEPQLLSPMVDRCRAREPVGPRSDVISSMSWTASSGEDARRKATLLRRSASASMEDPKDNVPTIDPEADKKRIRELEEKVRSLENELARRLSSAPPPAPPPPPPPPPLPSCSTTRIPLSASPRRGPGINSVLTSLRAGLKTANVPEASKAIPKNRLPTVPADKMEEFLSELKTVKLRRVGSGNSLSQSTANSSSGVEHSQSSSQGSSLMEDRPSIGYKRKRLDSGKEAQGTLVTSIKRRFTVSSQTPTASTSSAASTRLFLPPPHPSTLTHSRSSLAIPAVPQEVDGTTPSLCSDNDNDVEDRAPSTPPLLPSKPGISRAPNRLGSQQGTSAPPLVEVSVEVHAPRGRLQEREIRSLPSQAIQQKPSILPTTHRERSIPSTSTDLAPRRQLPHHTGDADDPFSRRPPSSPLPPETPRRPRPPGRVRSASKPATRPSIRSRTPSPSGEGDDDDLPSLSFAPPDESTPAPDPVGKRRPAQIQASRKQRRTTLDEEIRRVDPSYSDEERAVNLTEAQRRQSCYSDEERAVSRAEAQRRQSSYSDEEQALHDLDSGTLVGVGRRSKRLGFLAHGGAGGQPVMMGVGYVEGAEVEDQVASEQRTKEARVGKGKTKTRSNAGGKRKPKR
ncbi:hypothetical protein JB92DRAFT_3028972 [Gautieria morchelliformis]|nr:hypothetical protein JB92DRAFT_3028972 [Gautieria morchelliformis]